MAKPGLASRYRQTYLYLAFFELNISSWDGYLIELVKELGIRRIYIIDDELAEKVRDVEVENPIPRNIMKEYRRYVQEKIM
ncbi:MAG: hypothetical protein QW569_01035 [Candidatus Bathyarchaeia archaeon]